MMPKSFCRTFYLTYRKYAGAIQYGSEKLSQSWKWSQFCTSFGNIHFLKWKSIVQQNLISMPWLSEYSFFFSSLFSEMQMDWMCRVCIVALELQLICRISGIAQIFESTKTQRNKRMILTINVFGYTEKKGLCCSLMLTVSWYQRVANLERVSTLISWWSRRLTPVH